MDHLQLALSHFFYSAGLPDFIWSFDFRSLCLHYFDEDCGNWVEMDESKHVSDGFTVPLDEKILENLPLEFWEKLDYNFLEIASKDWKLILTFREIKDKVHEYRVGYFDCVFTVCKTALECSLIEHWVSLNFRSLSFFTDISTTVVFFRITYFFICCVFFSWFGFLLISRSISAFTCSYIRNLRRCRCLLCLVVFIFIFNFLV